MTSEIWPSAKRKSVAARRSKISACGLCDSHGNVSNAGSVAMQPAGPGKMPKKKRRVSANDSARRFESVTKNAGRRNSRVRYAAMSAFATSCNPESETWFAAATQLRQRSVHGGMAQHGFKSFANYGEYHACVIRTPLARRRNYLRPGGWSPVANLLQNCGGGIAWRYRVRRPRARQQLRPLPGPRFGRRPNRHP